MGGRRNSKTPASMNGAAKFMMAGRSGTMSAGSSSVIETAAVPAQSHVQVECVQQSVLPAGASHAE